VERGAERSGGSARGGEGRPARNSWIPPFLEGDRCSAASPLAVPRRTAVHYSVVTPLPTSSLLSLPLYCVCRPIGAGAEEGTGFTATGGPRHDRGEGLQRGCADPSISCVTPWIGVELAWSDATSEKFTIDSLFQLLLAFCSWCYSENNHLLLC
jgi:hypothetical protein